MATRAVASLLELVVKASAPPTPPKEPPIVSSGLWIPPREWLHIPTSNRSLGSSLRSIGNPPPDLRPPTPPPSFADTLASIRRLPETISEELEKWRALGRAIARGLDWLDRHLPWGPLDPYGQPVPQWNVHLFQLARRAYEGDFPARAAFLDEIGADNSADNVLFIENLLGPTFAPARLDRREPWERMRPETARGWLRDRLRDIKLEDNREKRILLPYEEDKHAGGTENEIINFMEAERKRFRQVEIRGVLPKRQYQVLMLLAEGYKQREIAEELGIGLPAVKTHAFRLRRNPNLLRIMRS